MGLLLLMGESSPTITVQPEDQTKTQGQTATFTVQARDAKRYQWSVSSDAGSTFEEINDATTSTFVTDTLAYPNDNQKLFRVVVGNSSGRTFSRSALLTVTNGGGLPE